MKTRTPKTEMIEKQAFKAFELTIELTDDGKSKVLEEARKHSGSGPDKIIFKWPVTATLRPEGEPEGHEFNGTASLPVNTTLYSGTEGVFCYFNDQAFAMGAINESTDESVKKLIDAIRRRNESQGLKPPKPIKPEKDSQPELASLATDEYLIHTSQENDAIMRARCDGKSFNSYVLNPQAGAITYENKGLSHRVQLALTPDEVDAGLSIGHLEKLVRSQDSDAALAHLYIMRVLAPPAPMPQRAYAGGWIDFDDVIDKIGWYPQTTQSRREMHLRIWDFLRYGERAHIIGKRTGRKYTDPSTGKEVNTEVHGAAWRILKTELPAQGSLYPETEVPVRAEVVMSQELTALVTSPHTAQYLPCGEVLGAIPGGKPAGAWARVIGLSLASFWRRNPRETQNGILRPTRRELLSHFAAKTAPFDEVLEGKNPARVIEYWTSALGILADSKFIAREGEATRNAKQIREALGRQGWQNAWLDEKVDIYPGEGSMKTAIQERAKALPVHKARDLKKEKTARRPRKSR